MRLQNKVAIITGAASGMGAEEAKLFAKHGAKVVATDVQFEKVVAVVEEIKAAGGEAIAVAHNVALKEDWEKVVASAIEAFGTIDVLINNAGIADRNPFGTPETMELDEWDRILDINLKSVFLGMKQVLPVMKEKKAGSIINVSSIAAMIGTGGPFAYTATKGGIRSMTKQVAAVYGEFNIRVNSIHPGGVKTPMIEEALQNPDFAKRVEMTTPLRRVAEPIEIANAALFLASDESSYMSGSEMVVDGGATSV